MATFYQVAIILWIKELLKDLYQKEADFLLRSRDKKNGQN
jgi:hypothetical protein